MVYNRLFENHTGGVWNSFLQLLFGLLQIVERGRNRSVCCLASVISLLIFFMKGDGLLFAGCCCGILSGGGSRITAGLSQFPQYFPFILCGCIGDSLVRSLVSLGFHCQYQWVHDGVIFNVYASLLGSRTI